MSAIPRMTGRSSFCLNTTTDTTAVSTMPKPPQMAYATPSGMVLRASAKQ